MLGVFIFSIGACIIVVMQTSVAAFFAKYLTSHPEVIAILKKGGVDNIYANCGLLFFYCKRTHG